MNMFEKVRNKIRSNFDNEEGNHTVTEPKRNGIIRATEPVEIEGVDFTKDNVPKIEIKTPSKSDPNNKTVEIEFFGTKQEYDEWVKKDIRFVENEFSGPYPSKCQAFLCGRIIHRLFHEQVGIPVPKGFESQLGFGKNNEVKIVFRMSEGIIVSFKCLKETIFLNARLGTLDLDEQSHYNLIMKWAESEGIK